MISCNRAAIAALCPLSGWVRPQLDLGKPLSRDLLSVLKPDLANVTDALAPLPLLGMSDTRLKKRTKV
jgi:hypothetical protein